jgi:septal ring factor EnvC (AmiA/AmiB activator)
MWPKALAQLIELAPHITRLVPAADRFLNTKTASEEASRNAMQQMAEGLRGDLGQVTASHAGLYRQLNEQSEKLAGIAADARATRAAVDLLEDRLARMEKLQGKQQFLLLVTVLLVAVLFLSLPWWLHLSPFWMHR